ncbi:MAG: stalk domain-containing protein [Fimbriimonas sp.]
MIAGIVAGASLASAYSVDATISIDRALNSPTLTVKYSGAKATLAELKLNGESISTRTLTGATSAGETNFNVALADLRDGDNEVEVILYDRAGKVVGSQKINIASEQGNTGPIYLSTPKVGQTVKGPVELKVGFNRDMKKAYVSFFINDEFKSMSNFPPFSFVWDTSKEANGWHDIEAWAVDDSSTTYKTRKLRVFVNNPGGRTERPGVGGEVLPRTNVVRAQVGAEAGLKAVGAANALATGLSTVTPTRVGSVRLPKPTVGAPIGTRANFVGTPVAAGQRFLTPTGTRNAVPVATNVVKAATTTVVTKSAALVPVAKGDRFPNLATFAVVFNSQLVKFDVAPRVDEGIPMTPLRHLLEKAGAKVQWENSTKSVTTTGGGSDLSLQIGEKLAKVGNLEVSLELAPYIDRGRTIVPISFIREALNVDVQFDKATGHVLITSKK